MDLRLIPYVIWAVAMLLVWGAVLFNDWRAYEDKLNRRNALVDLVPDLALFASAVAAAISLLVLVVGQDIPGLRGFALAVFLGGFLAAGIFKLTLRRRQRPTGRHRRQAATGNPDAPYHDERY